MPTKQKLSHNEIGYKTNSTYANKLVLIVLIC